MKIPVFRLMAILVAVQTYNTNAKSCESKSSESSMFLDGFVFQSQRVDQLGTCVINCLQSKKCASINMNMMGMTCDMNNSTKTRNPQHMVSRQNMIYMEMRDPPGTTPDTAVSSCKQLNQINNQAESGVYWIKVNETQSHPFQVFCEMTIDGGGWTLVYTYQFTDFSRFAHSPNAVTPYPNWPVARSVGVWTPESIVTPLNESSYSAMNFSLWKKIGREILFKSNIINWMACLDGTGSLVDYVKGSMSCRIVKSITPICKTTASNTIVLTNCGPCLLASRHQLCLYGRTDNCFPVHDPCGKLSKANHLTNVANPGGALYVR